MIYLLFPWLLCGLLHSDQTADVPEWGFFGHKLINRMAVFTLPPEMLPLYKSNIQYLEDHATDADKRRYASKHEAVRHYIDIDRWEVLPVDTLPRSLAIAVGRHATFHCLETGGDTIELDICLDPKNDHLHRLFLFRHIMPSYYEDPWIIDPDTVSYYLGAIDTPQCYGVLVVDHFSEHGILPYNLVSQQEKLTRAFIARDIHAIMRISADIGHYIGDAHVPLHTTENYNGQLTDQVGIHAFWESRIPELLASETFDFMSGKATYIRDIPEFYWGIIEDSHALVNTVLAKEKELSESYPANKQYCYIDRNGVTTRLQCPKYALKFNKALGGMVERRMKYAIHAIGSAWYTAWVDAGQPDLEVSHSETEANAVGADTVLSDRSDVSREIRPHER